MELALHRPCGRLGACPRYQRAPRSDVLAGVGATNTYGHMHPQAKDLYTAHAKPWYRTDGNGTVVVSTPGTMGGGYTVTVQKGSSSMAGAGDKMSSQTQCNPIP